MRLVLDTNVIVSALASSSGSPAQLLQLWREDFFALLVSEPILDEYRRVLGYDQLRRRHKLSDQEIDELVNDFRRFGDLIEITESLAIIAADSNDDRFLECAVAGEADYIVSGDHHLLDLRTFRSIQILSPRSFLRLIEEGAM